MWMPVMSESASSIAVCVTLRAPDTVLKHPFYSKAECFAGIILALTFRAERARTAMVCLSNYLLGPRARLQA